MAGTKPEKSHKIAIPVIVVLALVGATIGGLTGVSISYIIAFVVIGIVLPISVLVVRKVKSEDPGRDH